VVIVALKNILKTPKNLFFNIPISYRCN